jgi:hypothetical protein
MNTMTRLGLFFILVPASCLLSVSCDLASPEVAVVNMTDEHILLRNVSFNGCRWNTVLAYQESTSPGRCLPGEDRVHVEKFDPKTYCREQVEDGTIDDLCFCDEEDRPGDDPMDPGLINEEPMWFNYQTVSVKRVDYGEFHVFEITLDDLEQDFSVPGPYGH